jgi:quinol monooxygenase YgiN
MIVLLVHVQVKPEFIEAFKSTTLENARNSILEPGIARFDLIQNSEDPARFVLIEVYRAIEAREAHRQTDHYLRWRAEVEGMMAEPRQGIVYQALFPANADW